MLYNVLELLYYFKTLYCDTINTKSISLISKLVYAFISHAIKTNNGICVYIQKLNSNLQNKKSLFILLQNFVLSPSIAKLQMKF